MQHACRMPFCAHDVCPCAASGEIHKRLQYACDAYKRHAERQTCQHVLPLPHAIALLPLPSGSSAPPTRTGLRPRCETVGSGPMAAVFQVYPENVLIRYVLGILSSHCAIQRSQICHTRRKPNTRKNKLAARQSHLHAQCKCIYTSSSTPFVQIPPRSVHKLFLEVCTLPFLE